MPRLGGFPQNQPFNVESLFEPLTPASGAGTARMSLPPGPERDAAISEILQALQSQVDDVPALIEELRGLMVGRDLTQLINSVVVPAMTVGVSGGESLADGDATSTWAAKVEYLVGLALSVDPGGDADTPTAVIRRVCQLISDIFDAEQVRLITESLADADANDADREILLQQLQMEYQVDRMPGYAIHLEQVDAEVFGMHRAYYIAGLGFDPADVICMIRLYTRSVSQAFTAARDAVDEQLASDTPDVAAGAALLNALNAATLWNPSDVAAATGVAEQQITAMLDFFSTEFGCQPDFRAPGDSNRARTHPCIRLGDGMYLVPDPWSLSAVIHQRLMTEPKTPAFDPQKYHRHRQEAHERLVAAALEKVFGVPNVHSGQHYDLALGQHGEIDTLVCTEWPLVVEAKAITLSEAGRRGTANRVDSKIHDILGKALNQTDRALTYILDEGGRSFAPAQNGKPIQLLPDGVCGGTAVIVTFERIDPFASAGLSVAGNVNRPTWVVSITDLLMVADILTDPAAFHHYARTRADMHAAKASAAAEADALGAYLLDRLGILRDPTVDQGARILIGYSCEALNNFYTRQEVALQANKPITGVPDDVTNVLTNAMRQPGWVKSTDAVMSADPSSVWPKWKRFRQRRRHGRTFTLSDNASLVALAAGESSLQQTGDSITINIAPKC